MSFTNVFFMIALGLAGVVNFLPVFGVISGEAIAKAYGVALASPDLVVLMRHRAVLFGCVGGLMLSALHFRSLQGAAVVLGLVSMIAFMALCWGTTDTGPKLWRLFWIDLAATVVLVVAAGLKYGGGDRV